MDDYKVLRQNMIKGQLVARGIFDKKVLDAMNKVKREDFIHDNEKINAYYDGPLPIGNGQTISQPYMVAKMTEELELKGSEKVLEIGTSSGYQAAVLSLLAKEVISIERDKELAIRAEKRLKEDGYNNVKVIIGDGTKSCPAERLYDAIIVTAGAPYVPQGLIDQLSDGGRLVIPLGDRYSQVLTKVIKKGNQIEKQEGILCVFVPLKGEEGWPET